VLPVKRLALLGLTFLALGTGPADAATKEYSTGNINQRIGGALDRTLNVPDSGAVSFIRVSFRISAPTSSALSISLVSPKGTEIPLVAGRGTGADFGSGTRGCRGFVTVLDSDTTTNPASAGRAPFTDNPYGPEGDLRSLYGQAAQGRWTLRIANAGGPATLHCLTLDISRAVPETLTATRGSVHAALGFLERNYLYESLRVKVVRAGRVVVDAPIQQLGCRECDTFRPVAVKVRDLDGGGPEVLFDLFTGGAHCCSAVLVLRYDPAARTYRSKVLGFGNYGYRLADLDDDGLLELSAFDERFLYTFTAYVFSVAPPRITQYRQGKLVDVTRRFPQAIRRSAAVLAKSFRVTPEKNFDARAYVAAYVADQYLLGEPDEAKRALAFALAHGALYRGKEHLGWPAGRNFITVLTRDLRRWGYLS
jgi:subtilisin-like proprotein convertase family protein